MPSLPNLLSSPLLIPTPSRHSTRSKTFHDNVRIWIRIEGGNEEKRRKRGRPRKHENGAQEEPRARTAIAIPKCGRVGLAVAKFKRCRRPEGLITVNEEHSADEISGAIDDYDLDEGDELFLRNVIYGQFGKLSKDVDEALLERLMSAFVDAAPTSFAEALLAARHLPTFLRDPLLVLATFDHFRAKGSPANSGGIKVGGKNDDNDDDPYVCFRPRTVKAKKNATVEVKTKRAQVWDVVSRVHKVRALLVAKRDEARALLELTLATKAKLMNRLTDYRKRVAKKAAKPKSTHVSVDSDSEEPIDGRFQAYQPSPKRRRFDNMRFTEADFREAAERAVMAEMCDRRMNVVDKSIVKINREE